MKRQYYWPRLSTDVQAYVATCNNCLSERVTHYTTHLAMKLFPAAAPPEFVAMDILSSLPTSTNKNQFILVICSLPPKGTQTDPLRTVTASTCASAFIHECVLHYGVPSHVRTDRGNQFLSQLFRTLCRLLFVNVLLTTAYHSQKNGLMERYNTTMFASIRPFIAKHQRDWDVYLASLTYAYNALVHRTTNCRPLQLALLLCTPDSSLFLPL